MAAGGWEWGCVRIEISGKVTVITGTTPHGQGQETSFAQIAADWLGVPIEDIVVLHGDTATAHFGRDTYGSRATALGGTAIVMSIEKIIEKAKSLAAALLKSTPKEIEFKDGKFFVTGETAERAWVGSDRERGLRREKPAARIGAGARGVELLRAAQLHLPFRDAHRRGRGGSRHGSSEDLEIHCG